MHFVFFGADFIHDHKTPQKSVQFFFKRVHPWDGHISSVLFRNFFLGEQPKIFEQILRQLEGLFFYLTQ